MGALLWNLADGVASVGAGAFCQNIKSTIILITYGIGWPSDTVDAILVIFVSMLFHFSQRQSNNIINIDDTSYMGLWVTKDSFYS